MMRGILSIAVLALLGQFCVVDAQFQQLNNTGCFFWTQWTSYSSVSSCIAACGTGETHRERTRTCLRPIFRPRHGCRLDEVEMETTTCNSAIPCNGVVGSWSDWESGTCSQFCGQGTVTQTRSRNCSTPDVCDVPLTETQTEGCEGAGGTCRIRCTGFQTFFYLYREPITHMCLQGSYVQIPCPSERNELVRTCGMDNLRCQVYRIIERWCFPNNRQFSIFG